MENKKPFSIGLNKTVIRKNAYDIEIIANELGWVTEEFKVAQTNSIYITLVRDGREWVVIRISDHKQVYHHWLTTYSISPGNLYFDDMVELLKLPFGKTGDIML